MRMKKRERRGRRRRSRIPDITNCQAGVKYVCMQCYSDGLLFDKDVDCCCVLIPASNKEFDAENVTFSVNRPLGVAEEPDVKHLALTAHAL